MKSFADLANYIVDTVFVFNMEARIVYINDAALKNYGYLREEMLGESMLIIDINITEASFKEFWSKATVGTSRTIESLHYRRNRDHFPVEIHSILIEDSGE